MPTVQQIIDFADRKYPNSETDANKIIDLNMIHKEVYNEIIRMKNIYELYTSYTVADQLTYSVPTGSSPENILRIEISGDVTGSIDDETVWQEYKYAVLNDGVDDGHYWSVVDESTIIITKDGAAIDTSNYEIRFFYYPNPTSLTAVTDTPDLDEQYHDLLKFALIQEMASQGQNPDTEVANYWQAKFDERLKKVKKSLKERYEGASIFREQLESRW